jgi:multisubunit Na+/H+ antiporter MnhG subunit
MLAVLALLTLHNCYMPRVRGASKCYGVGAIICMLMFVQFVLAWTFEPRAAEHAHVSELP